VDVNFLDLPFLPQPEELNLRRIQSSDTVSCTFTYHTWQFIIFTIFTITACIFSISLSISF